MPYEFELINLLLSATNCLYIYSIYKDVFRFICMWNNERHVYMVKSSQKQFNTVKNLEVIKKGLVRKMVRECSLQ